MAASVRPAVTVRDGGAIHCTKLIPHSWTGDPGIRARARRARVTAMLVAAAVFLLGGCSYFISSASESMAADLASTIRNQDDPKTVQDGAPAYLLLIDSLITGDPENPKLLLAGANLYGSYAGAFVQDAARAQRLTDKAWTLSQRAMCQQQAALCGWNQQPFDKFVAALPAMTTADVPTLYTYATTWAGWIQVHQSDWNAVADIPKVGAVMQRVLTLDEAHDHGGAHIYLGFLATLLPPSLGGKPDEARAHFERASELSHGRNLMAVVMLAERYARTVFDRPLHDRVLKEVLAADPHERNLTLMNTLAQQRASELLESADAYF